MLTLANLSFLVFLFASLSFSVCYVKADNEEESCYPHCEYNDLKYSTVNQKYFFEDTNYEVQPETVRPSSKPTIVIIGGVFIFVLINLKILLYCVDRRESNRIRSNMNTFIACAEDHWTQSHAVSTASAPSQNDDQPTVYSHNVNNIRDHWTRRTGRISNFEVLPPCQPTDDQPPAYPDVNVTDNSRVITPSAPLVFVDVNGSINDDPPSYFEVVMKSP